MSREKVAVEHILLTYRKMPISDKVLTFEKNKGNIVIIQKLNSEVKNS